MSVSDTGTIIYTLLSRYYAITCSLYSKTWVEILYCHRSLLYLLISLLLVEVFALQQQQHLFSFMLVCYHYYYIIVVVAVFVVVSVGVEDDGDVVAVVSAVAAAVLVAFSGDDDDQDEDIEDDEDVTLNQEYNEYPDETHRVHEPVVKLVATIAASLGSDGHWEPHRGQASCW